MSVCVPVPHCFNYCDFVMLSEVKESDTSSSILCSKYCFGYSGSFCFCINFKIICSNFVKNALNSVVGIILNL